MKKKTDKLKYYSITNKITFFFILCVVLMNAFMLIITGSLLSKSNPEIYLKILKIFIPSALVYIIATSFFARFFIVKYMHGGIQFLKWLGEKMSKGDYTFVANENRFKKDEFGELNIAFNDVIKNTRVLIDHVYDALNDLNIAIENVQENSNQVSAASDEILKSSEEIAKGATEQATMTEKGVEGAQELGDIVENNNGLIEAVDEISKNILARAEE